MHLMNTKDYTIQELKFRHLSILGGFMNKLQGFFALQKSSLPAVPWKKFDESVKLNSDILWTIRTAVMTGDDLNLPRKVGVTALEAEDFANELLCKLGYNDMVIYYPYFIAIKSGVLDVSNRRIVIEAVKDDLWNLVTHNKKDVTIIFEEDDLHIVGDEQFLSQDELFELIDYCTIVKRHFLEEILEGKNVMLEWSYACKSDINKRPIGNSELIFYEVRTI